MTKKTFVSFTEKNISFLILSRIHFPGSGSTDPDPDQSEMDPQHCLKVTSNS